ncbi:TPA: hypothetical protein OZK91_003307 [Legionella pneumophila]|nr:hypothetical protein [Legionella pneumophila]HBB7075687.1 hypothetical protein [Legionella pneumophila]HBD7419801.1 hypothetical protein [Legionella pneumophila]HCX3359988.1 hypothetical protein [Legionella pneumophila]HCX3400346.1 hypothetical protein [Legionella pneumophila]
MNPNDKIRDQILQWFYDRNASAKSRRGKNGSEAKISEIKKGLKDCFGLSPKEVIANLTYLIDKGWINESEITKTVKTKEGNTIPSSLTWYVISSAGIDKLEAPSDYRENIRYPGINIGGEGSIINIGNGNIVNVNYKPLHDELETLKQTIAKSNLDDNQKLEVSVDIETLKDQLAKNSPDKTIVGYIWSKIEKVAEISGFHDAIVKIAPLVSSLIQ